MIFVERMLTVARKRLVTIKDDALLTEVPGFSTADTSILSLSAIRAAPWWVSSLERMLFTR